VKLSIELSESQLQKLREEAGRLGIYRVRDKMRLLRFGY
jgi:hypothetical protein